MKGTEIISAIHTAKKQFKENLGEAFGQQYVQLVKVGSKTIIGIHADDQVKIDYAKLRESIALIMGFETNTLFDQIVGDSAIYGNADSAKESDAVCSVILKHLQSNNNIMLYGYTGHIAGNRVDVNGAVESVLEKNPHLAKRVVGNVVDYHTPLALERWGCQVSDLVDVLVLVYSDNKFMENGQEKFGARFGDDVLTSDSLTNGTLFICGGGIQSLNQGQRMAANGLNVFSIQGLRGDQNPSTQNPETKEYVTFLEAAEFLNLLKVKNQIIFGQLKRDMTSEEFDEFTKTYNSTHQPAAPWRADYPTKSKLQENAMKEFQKNFGWAQLKSNFSTYKFENGQIIPTETMKQFCGADLLKTQYFDCFQEHDDSESLFAMIKKLANKNEATTAMVCFEIENIVSSPFMFCDTKIFKLQEATKYIELLSNENNKSEMELVKQYISSEIHNIR